MHELETLLMFLPFAIGLVVPGGVGCQVGGQEAGWGEKDIHQAVGVARHQVACEGCKGNEVPVSAEGRSGTGGVALGPGAVH